jgi:RNA polymerase sigma factor (sigma-70 family)
LDITEEAFNKFLSWLHPDREEAGKKYEGIRRHLIVILTCRGCAEPEDLADETINRVIRRAPHIADTYLGEPIPYFITVAHRLYLEYAAKRQSRAELPPDVAQPPDPDPEEEREYECLEACIQELTPANRNMLLQYYQGDKQAKINRRKRLADEMGIELNALRIRTHRARSSLQQCIDKCLEGPTAQEAAHEMDRGQHPY